jgi:hypothetical protein
MGRIFEAESYVVPHRPPHPIGAAIGGRLHHAVRIDRPVEVSDSGMTLRLVPIDLASKSAIV